MLFLGFVYLHGNGTIPQFLNESFQGLTLFFTIAQIFQPQSFLVQFTDPPADQAVWKEATFCQFNGKSHGFSFLENHGIKLLVLFM